MKIIQNRWIRSFVTASAGLLLLACFLSPLAASAADAPSISLAWDPSSESALAGYNLYRSTQSGVFGTASVNSSPLANASFIDTTVLSGTTYYYVVRAVSSDGSESVSSNQIQAITTAPVENTPSLAAPAGLAARCSSDLKSFTVSWTAVPGADNYYLRVDHEANNKSDGTWLVDGTDFYIDGQTATSFAGPVVTGQSYNLWVHSANAASGIGSASSTSFICGDPKAPVVSITAPTAGSASSSPNLKVSADASDSVGVVGVQFQLNGANLGTEDTTAPYSISWNTKNKANGIYTLQAVARNAAGNRTTSAPVSVTLKNGKTTRVLDPTVTALSSASETMVVGYARAEMEEDPTDSTDVAVISLKSGDNVVSEASVAASAPIRDGRIYVDVEGAVNTGVAIANDNNEAAQISFYFTDATGADFGHGSFTLEAKQTITAFANQAPFNLSVSMKGSMTFNSSVPVAVTALRGFTNQRNDFLMTTLPVGSVGAGSAGTSVVFPHFADGDGWTTQVVLTNPTDAQLAGTVQFLGQGSQPTPSALTMTVNGVTGSSFNYSIAPRSAVRLVTANASTEVHVGYVLATTANHTPLPEGLSIFSYVNQGITVSEAGVPAVTTGTALRTYVESVGTLRSGLAIANPSVSPAKTTLELIESDGLSTGLKASVEIPAGGHTARFINELFPTIPEGFKGTLRIVSTQSVAAIGLRLRPNDRGDVLITSIPVIDEASAPVQSSGSMFPLVVTGGGYSTDFIRIKK